MIGRQPSLSSHWYLLLLIVRSSYGFVPDGAARVGERLSGRDWTVIEVVNRLRLVTGEQIERSFFAEPDRSFEGRDPRPGAPAPR